MRRLVKILTSRVISIALSIIAQIVFLYLSLCRIASFDKFQPFMEAVALVIVIYIINKTTILQLMKLYYKLKNI